MPRSAKAARSPAKTPPRRSGGVRNFLLGVLVGVLLATAGYVLVKQRLAGELAPDAGTVIMQTTPAPGEAAAKPPAHRAEAAPPPPKAPAPPAPRPPVAADAQVQDDAAAVGMTGAAPPAPDAAPPSN